MVLTVTVICDKKSSVVESFKKRVKFILHGKFLFPPKILIQKLLGLKLNFKKSRENMVIPVGLKHIFTHRLFVEFPTYLIKLSHMLSVNFRIKKKQKKKNN